MVVDDAPALGHFFQDQVENALLTQTGK